MVKVTVTGGDALARKLTSASDDVKKKAKDVLNAGLIDIQSTAKENSPVDTGRLRSSIRMTIDSNGLGGSVQTNVAYAPFVEFGTKRMSARPFLFPAWEQHKKEIVKQLEDAIKGIL